MTTRSRDIQPTFVDPLDQQSLGAIISGQHGAPFDVLGPHRLEIDALPDGSLWIVRAFVPGAEAVSVVPDLSPYPLPDAGRGREASGVAEGQHGGAGRTSVGAGLVPPSTAPTSARRRKTASGDAPSSNGSADGVGGTVGARQVSPATSGETIPMRLLHPAGLWSAIVDGSSPPGPPRARGGEAERSVGEDGSPSPRREGRSGGEDAPRYMLQIRWPDGEVERVHDPYAFPPQLSDFDLHLIGEGKHYDLYEKLGAHPTQVDGVPGVRFAVWAPNARRVSVVGDFNGWDERMNPMRLRSGGIWELFLPGVTPGANYKYAILSWNQDWASTGRPYKMLKADPYAFWAEVRPGTASRVYELAGYHWNDADWTRRRAEHNGLDRPILVYELHAGSWRPSSSPGGAHANVSYRDLAQQLVPYLNEMGYTHVELMPIAEHPFDGSWGYQVTGYYAPTSRYGTPHDFMYFVDYCHQHGIGVILDWVPAHYPKDEWALGNFDGSHLYEHADWRQGEHREWGTYVFNVARNEVRNFLVANALFWIEKYHVDGLRVDAVASLLYLDYGRKEGEWVPNQYGGRENLAAVEFLKEFNEAVHSRHPHALTIAEESTAWPKVTWPVQEGGLGFSLKWNMGWMHDILEYFALDPVYREHHHGQLTFSTMYMHSERFILPFSHDEVVHMKGSLLNKMAGDRWQKFANLRALYAYMTAHPGKKLLFMGSEFAQWSEWHYEGWLDWHVLGEPLGHFSDGPEHEQVRRLVRDLNAMVREHPSLHERDFEPAGFGWIDGSDAQHSVLAFLRYGADGRDPLLFVTNFTPVPRYEYRVGVPTAGFWEEALNTDAAIYGGSNLGNLGGVESEPVAWHGREHSVRLTLPPLSVIALRPINHRDHRAQK